VVSATCSLDDPAPILRARGHESPGAAIGVTGECAVTTSSNSALARLFVSLVIVGILSIQAVAGFVDTGRWGWPLLAYPMYKTAHDEGERLDVDLTAYAVLAASTRVAINRSDLNLSFWLYWYNVVTPIQHARLDLLRPVLRRYCEQSDNQVVKLHLEDQGAAIGRDGPIEGLPPEIVAEMDVTCP
jgi:hypothetical protein